MRPVRPASARRKRATGATTALLSQRYSQLGFPWLSICRPRWGSDSAPRHGNRREWAASALQSPHWPIWRPSVPGHPFGGRLDVHDDQPRRRRPCWHSMRWCARRQGADCSKQACRHDPERHPQGVYRARYLYLSATRPGHAHYHRYLCLGRTWSCPSGIPISISGYHIREAGSTVARRRNWLSPSPMRSRYIDADDSSGFGRGFICATPFVLLQCA